MIKTVLPGAIFGKISVQPSKSVLHRAIICAALAKGESRIQNTVMSDDVSATLECAKALGLCEYKAEENSIIIAGGGSPKKAVLDCKNSATTYRLLLPVASATAGGGEFILGNTLKNRPIEPLKNAMEMHGARFCGNAVFGSIAEGEYTIEGDVSSQFVSGLMLALSCLEGNSEISVLPPFESRSYVLLTEQVMKAFGAGAEVCGNEIKVCGGGYKKADFPVEADWSQAAVFAAAGVLSGEVELINMPKNSLQADAQIIDILVRMGAKVEDNTFYKSELKGIEIDASQTPDIVPILAVCACAASGETHIFGAKRLRTKESDRLKTTALMLKALGADVFETEDGLVIRKSALKGGRIQAYDDHRIAMAAAVAACICENEVVIDGAECVSKSAPDFYIQLGLLGGQVI